MRRLIFLCVMAGQLLFMPALGSEAQTVRRIQTQEIRGVVYADGGFRQELTPASPEYNANFDPEGFGIFGWQFTNTTSATLQNLRFVVFLDVDVDRESNTFFNEYGGLSRLVLPPGSPPGAITASDWEIDEPGFLFGDLARRLSTGVLDNANAVPANARDDVALALGFQIGALAPDASADFAFSISAVDIGGLSQTDSDSNLRFYFNGYGTSTGVTECVTTCFRSPQYYHLNLQQLTADARLRGAMVVIGKVNDNVPIFVENNIERIRLALSGGAPGYITPTTPMARLNQEFVAAQLSVALAGGGRSSPAAISVLMSRLRCHGGLKNFTPVLLGNGVTLTPDSTLTDLFQQALLAIREQRSADMDVLAAIFDLLNGNDPIGRCGS